jgi:ribosomal protein S18 acetylase RimI-like enzyme
MNIRRATSNDAEAMATHMLLAMEDIVYQFIGERDTTKAKEFLLHFAAREANQYSWQNCWVGEEEGAVVATVNLYDGAQLNALRQPVVEHIRSRFHNAFQPEDETGPGEYYIDTVGVDGNHRGKDIGSKLLQFLVEEYVTKRGQTLGLLVDEENPKAKRLYLKVGFAPVGKKVLFGKLMEHLQIKA